MGAGGAVAGAGVAGAGAAGEVAEAREVVEGLGRTVSGLVLRLVIGLAGIGAVTVQVLDRLPVGALLLGAALAVAAALWPASPLPAAVLLAALVAVGLGGGGIEGRDVVTMLLSHVCHAAAGLAAAVPARARVELAALGSTGRRLVVVQALALAVAAVAALLRGSS